MQHSDSEPNQSQSPCAEEKIHIPGAIQPHGVLIAVTEQTLYMVQASESALNIFGIAHQDLIGQPIETLIGSEQQAELARQIAANTILLNPLRLTVNCKPDQKEFEAAIHRSDGLLIIEFEETKSLQPEESLHFFRTNNQAVAQLMACTGQQQLLQSAAEFVRTLTGFDRILIYLFDQDWNGTVLAECKAAEVNSYMGLKFPASDIPAQARKLYTRNRLRLLVNVEADPSPICPSNNPLTSAPLDLSESILRTMSPVHIEYLKNMGVGASMSLSLISNGELRGLIVCHHTGAKHVDFRVRQACDFLARLVSLQIDAIQERETFNRLEVLKDARKDLLLHISEQEDIPSAIASSGKLLEITGARGGAVVWDERCFLVGKTPDELQVAQLAAELSQTSLTVFVSDSICKQFSIAKSIAVSASGMLAIRLATNGSKWLLWFRPEQLEELSWAGKQEEIEQGPFTHILPRKSFEIWKETVKGKSVPWLSSEVQSALQLRTDVLDITLSISEKKRAADLERQVKELDSLSQQLLVARDAAMEASQRKSEFVSVVSHDLRTPLTSIKAALSLLLSGRVCEIERDGVELATIAHDGCNFLLNLINDLLNLESIESGSVTLEKSEVPVSNLIDEAFQYVRSAAVLDDITLVAEVESITVLADKDRLLQVLMNLISNAIKFSPAHSRIIVSAQSNNGVTTFKVADQGRGIPLEFRQSIFQKFKQVEATDRQKKGGAGLGLAICKALVEAHGGAIGVESELHKGSTFWFSIPLSGSKDESAKVPVSESKFLEHTRERNDFEPRLMRNERELAVVRSDSNENAILGMEALRRILLVEDNYDDFELMEHYLATYKEAGLLLEHSDCLAAALSRLQRGGIDLILLDLSLPDSQGIETVKKICLSAPEIPIIVLSGMVDTKIAMESLTYGAEDYLIKGSFNTASLVHSINYALARHIAREANERLATIVEASSDAIIGKTLNGTITSWNKGAAKLFGYSAEEATGKSVGLIFPPESSAELTSILSTIASGETIRNLETVRLNKNGDKIDILATISPIRRADGTVTSAAAIDRDITERKHAQKVLQESEERYRLIVAGVKDYAIFMLDPNGLVESWNEGAELLKGYTAAEIIGKHFSVFYTAHDRQLGLPDSHLKTAIAQGGFEDEGWRLRKDGSHFFADVVMTPLYSAAGELRGFTKVTRDITERMKSQKEVADARLRLTLALEAAAIGVWDFDLIKNSIWRSLRHDEIFGHQDLLPEWNYAIFKTYVVPEDLASVKEAFKLGFEHGTFRMQCRIIRANDKEMRWISLRGETFRNEQGTAVRMIGTVADITDIKEKQEKERLLTIMKEREDFMATLTHDMKNPLIGADRLLQMLVAGSLGEMTSQQREMLQCLRESNSELLKLIADLIDVYRFEKDVNLLSIADCDVVSLISSCLNRIVPLADLRSVNVITQLPEKMEVQADARRLERVVQNLLDNALKFAPDDGTINVRVFTTETNTVIEIEDNGPGIPSEEQPRLFQRFAQGSAGKRYTGGTGLGLYLCKQIVEAHGGTIKCMSQPNRATIFQVNLPKANNKKETVVRS